MTAVRFWASVCMHTIIFGKHLCILLSNFKLSTSGFTHHPSVTKARAALHVHVCTLTQLATRGFWVNLHLVTKFNVANLFLRTIDLVSYKYFLKHAFHVCNPTRIAYMKSRLCKHFFVTNRYQGQHSFKSKVTCITYSESSLKLY